MEKFSLSEFTKGWILGDFEPSLLKTQAVEMAIKSYSAGDLESRHTHKIATEYTIVVCGKVVMNEQVFDADDIVVINPGESADFHVIEDTITVVIKVPSIVGDKYSE